MTPSRTRQAAGSLVTLPVEVESDILGSLRDTPIGGLLASHNLGRVPSVGPSAELMIITCMDQRISLDIPPSFAFQIRTAGATPSPVLSNVAFAVAAAGVCAICVIAHTDCAMCRLDEAAGAVTDHLVATEGWSASEAREQEAVLGDVFRVGDPVQAAWSDAQELARRFPSCLVAPLLYRVEDGALLQVVDRQA